MFSHIFSLSFVRSHHQAVGFYIFYIFLTLVISLAFGSLIGIFLPQPYAFPTDLGAIIDVSVVFILTFGILHKKKLLKELYLVLLGLAAVIVSYYFSILIGLVFTSYLSMIVAKN